MRERRIGIQEPEHLPQRGQERHDPSVDGRRAAGGTPHPGAGSERLEGRSADRL